MSEPHSTIMKWLAILFAVFMLTIIFLANMGAGHALLDLANRLPGRDVTGHFILMGTLSFLVNAALRGARVSCFGLRLPHGTLIVAALVTLEEASQSLMPSRTFSLLDLAGSLAGVLLCGQLAGLRLTPSRGVRMKNPPPAPPRRGA
jgi:hypothetical protein